VAGMIFVCSPYRGNIKVNTENARQYCQRVIKETGEIPIAPHLYFPQFLNEENPVERERGINAGLKLLELCNEIWVFGESITAGMSKEIQFARRQGKIIKYIIV
jgi:hypothetical protein